VIVQVVSLAQTLVVARLLTPAEIGVYAAGTVLTGVLVMLSEGGLRGALIQREHDVEDAAVTVFWATLFSGFALSLLALAASPLIGLVFDNRTAGVIAAITSGGLLLHALTNVPDALMQRRFNFKRTLIVGPATAISYAITAVTCAALGFGVWALVIGTYASQIVWVIATWTLMGWRPITGRASVRLWRELARFGLPLVLDGAAYRVREVVEITLVGRSLNESSLGQYHYGRRLSVIPGVAIVQIAGYVLFPAFSRIAGDAERFQRAFLRTLVWLWCAATPMTALVIAIGEPLVVVLLGEPWRGAGVALVAMSGFGLGEALYAVTAEPIKGAGRARLLNWMTLAGLVSGIGVLLALLPLGLLGVGLAFSAAALCSGVTGLVLVSPVVRVPFREMLARMWPPVAASMVSVALVMPLEHLIVLSDRRGIAGGLGLLLAESVLFGVVYLAVLRFVGPSLFREVTAGVAGIRSRLRPAR